MSLQQRACGLVIFRRFQGTIQYLLMQTSYGEHHWTPPKVFLDKNVVYVHSGKFVQNPTNLARLLWSAAWRSMINHLFIGIFFLAALLHWCSHVDSDESDMETALRETQEETGFLPNDLKIFEDARNEIMYEVKGKPKIVVYWLAQLLTPNKPVKLSDEHQAFDWLHLREACERAKYDDMRKVLNEFDKYITRNLA